MGSLQCLAQNIIHPQHMIAVKQPIRKDSAPLVWYVITAPIIIAMKQMMLYARFMGEGAVY